MKIAIFAGLHVEKKLLSKLLPLTHLSTIEKIYLFRREPLQENYPKIICISAPTIIRGSKILSEIFRSLAFIKMQFSTKFDYVAGIYFMPHLCQAWLFSQLCRIPLISIIIENPKLYEQNHWFKKIVQASTIVAVRGEGSRAYVQTLGVSPDKIFIPQNVFTLEEQKNLISTKEYDLILVGHFDQDKRIDIFISAVAELKESLPDVSAVIVGDGVLRHRLEALIQEFHLEKNITLVGYQTDVDTFLKQAKVLALTSETEGLPMVMLEAMSFGLPCVVSNVGDIADIAKDNVNALLVEANNVHAFAESFNRVLTDQNLYDQLSRNALKTIAEKANEFSVEFISAQWKEMLDK